MSQEPESKEEEPVKNGNHGGKLPDDWPHQLRQVVAGLLGIVIACFDRWYFPEPEKGFSSNVDELVLLISLGVVAGAAGLFRMPK